MGTTISSMVAIQSHNFIDDFRTTLRQKVYLLLVQNSANRDKAVPAKKLNSVIYVFCLKNLESFDAIVGFKMTTKFVDTRVLFGNTAPTLRA
jgi:hypothetical protein